MYTFGFFTSYTNIPYHKLKSVMGELMKFCVNGGDKKLIGTTRYGAIWKNRKTIGCI